MTIGCIWIIESYRFLSSSSEDLVENLDVDVFEILRHAFPDHWEFLVTKLAYPYEFYNCVGDYQKPVDNLKNEDFYSKKCLSRW